MIDGVKSHEVSEVKLLPSVRSVAIVVTVSLSLFVGGCAIWNRPTVLDAEEGWQVYNAVHESGTLPEGAELGRSQTRSKRLVYIVGVEDQAGQERLLDAARDARLRHSSKPVVVVFFKKRRDENGKLITIRRESIP